LTLGVSGSSDQTVSAVAPHPPVTAGAGPALFLVACGYPPLTQPARLLLGELDEVRIRRGDDGEPTSRGRSCELAIADREISSKHARVTRVGPRWAIEDLGSKNGTFVNGVRVTVAGLVDGDVIDTGHAVFRFREAIDQQGPRLVRAAGAAHLGMTSLVPSVQGELESLQRVAASTVTILVEGEPGTGKEITARTIHALSQRPGALVAVNCGALARERVEAELFGWKRGAFAGAAEHVGLVRSADRGPSSPAAANATTIASAIGP